METVLAFTDGACLGNPGPGGYGALLRIGSRERELSGSEPVTTNNRMELMAAIVALEALKRPVRVQLHSDSQYVLKGMREWIAGWKARGWRTKDKKDVSNRDLWERLDRAAAPHEVEWIWVKGHAGHVENERVDRLANAAAVRARDGGHAGAGDAASAFLQERGESARAGESETSESGARESKARKRETSRLGTEGTGSRDSSPPAAGEGRVGVAPGNGEGAPLRAKLEGELHVGCALAVQEHNERENAPSWCLYGVGNTGVHCFTGSGEAVCPHAVPSLALGKLEVGDARGQAHAFELDPSGKGADAERVSSLLRALSGEKP